MRRCAYCETCDSSGVLGFACACYGTSVLWAHGKRSSRLRGGAVRSVSATEAAKNFGRLVDLVRENRVEYVVERAGVPVATIAPVSDRAYRGRDLVALLRGASVPDAAFGRAVEPVERV